MATIYEIAPNTEAAKRYQAYIDSVEESRQRLAALATELGTEGEAFLKKSDGTICGVKLSTQPDGWKGVKGWAGYYFPSRSKAKNAAARSRFASINLGSGEQLAVAMFGERRIYFRGMSAMFGVGGDIAQGRTFIMFSDDAHAKSYEDIMPAGLHRIRESDYLRAKEDEQEAAEAAKPNQNDGLQP
jgi:hypothetical protein